MENPATKYRWEKSQAKELHSYQGTEAGTRFRRTRYHIGQTYRLFATNAVGSLNPEFKIGQIVAFDQFINHTNGRADTFYDESVAHVSTAEPYCMEMRTVSTVVANRLGIDYRDGGSVIVVNGPRFSTKAESLFFSKQGFDMINMTQYPEAALAKERCMCYLALGIVTDYDAGIAGRANIKPVSHKEVIETFSNNIGKVKDLVKELIKEMPEQRKCGCAASMDNAIIKV